MFSDNSSCKNVMGSEILKSIDITGSHPFQQQNHQSSGLMRFRSAPSSFLASLIDRGGNSSPMNGSADNFMANDGSSSSDSESVFSSLLNCNGSVHNGTSDSRPLQFMKPGIAEESHRQSTGKGDGDRNGMRNCETRQMGYEASGMRSYAMGMEMQRQLKNESNLIRQSSTEGFFSGFDTMREVGNYRPSNGTNGEASSSTSGFNNHIKYSSAQHSGSNYMPSIAENESWNDSSLSCLKRTQEGDLKMFSTFNGMGSQAEILFNGESRNHLPGLAHHLSLPKTSAEMVATEKYLNFQQDTVLCKIRAKRGCATHPRSIAERNRRTRISERMKKLHELFPNMDKTNTADMLDLAVEHIKVLQKQVRTLTDKRAKCTCSSKAQPYSHGRS